MIIVPWPDEAFGEASCVYASPVTPVPGTVQDECVSDFEKIGEEPYVVIAPAAHRLARSRNVSWQALAAVPWVLTRKP